MDKEVVVHICNGIWYIYTMEYYSAITRNTFEPVLMRWINLESLIQSEIRKRNINII